MRKRSFGLAAGVWSVSLALLTSLPTAAATVQGVSAVGQDSERPQVAVDRKGRAIVVWEEGTTEGRIRLRRRSAAGTFAPIQTLSATGQDSDNPRLAVHRGGAAFAVWRGDDGTDRRIQLRRRSASGTLGQIQTLSAAGQSALEADVAVDATGNAFVVWRRSDGANERVQLRRRSASGNLSPIQTLSAAGQDAVDPGVAVDADGNAFVVWDRFDGANQRIQLRRRSASGKLGPIRTLSAAGQDASDPQIAVDLKGNAFVIWNRRDGANERVQLRRRSASGNLGPIQTLSAAGQNGLDARIAIDAKGRAFVVWRRSDGANARIQLRRRSASGNLGPVQTLSAAGQDAGEPHVGVDARGNVFVVWRRSDGANDRIQLRRRAASGNLGPVRTLSDTGQDAEDPRVAAGGGNAFTVWVNVGFDLIQGARVAAG